MDSQLQLETKNNVSENYYNLNKSVGHKCQDQQQQQDDQCQYKPVIIKSIDPEWASRIRYLMRKLKNPILDEYIPITDELIDKLKYVSVFDDDNLNLAALEKDKSDDEEETIQPTTSSSAQKQNENITPTTIPITKNVDAVADIISSHKKFITAFQQSKRNNIIKKHRKKQVPVKRQVGKNHTTNIVICTVQKKIDDYFGYTSRNKNIDINNKFLDQNDKRINNNRDCRNE